MRYEVTTTIDAPVDLVWQTVSEIEKWPDWSPTMTSVRRLDTGELRAGSTAEVHQPTQPPRRWTVSRVEPRRSFAWETSGAGLRLFADHVLSGPDGQVEVLLTFTTSGVLGPVAGLFAGKTIRRLVDTEASSLKAWCEKNR